MMKVQHKIRSLLRRRSDIIGLKYDWHARIIEPIPTIKDYQQHLAYLYDKGYLKRSEYLVHEPIESHGSKWKILLCSYGDLRTNRVAHGENPLAASFGVCLFDHVVLLLLPLDPDPTTCA